VLAATGWQPEGARPSAAKFVLIAAPHTSNWDLLYLLALAAVFGVNVRWMGKHTLFRGPAGPVLRALGGIPIRRHRNENVVQAMARAFAECDELALVVPAEGTRSRAPYWKSGFYHIARSAGVPIVMGYLDYPRRRGGFGPALVPSGDVRADMDRIRAFYADKVGRHPAGSGPVRLREEDDAPPDAAPVPPSSSPPSARDHEEPDHAGETHEEAERAQRVDVREVEDAVQHAGRDERERQRRRGAGRGPGEV
jgi:1-acyl-sn-glycerol-3-phosphate acyltransferase